MTPADVDFLAELVRQRAGVVLPPDGAYLAETQLAPIARTEHHPATDGLIAALRNSPPEPLLALVTEALLNSETQFFRDRVVFQALREFVLPTHAAARPGGVVRVWSAACGTGQEPYSLAMLGAELGLNLDLCASDLSERALEKARSGLYTQFEVQRGLPVAQLLRSFDKVEDAWRVRPALRQAIRWRRFNLLDDAAPLGRFDLILCRNLTSQMTAQAQAAVLGNMARVLAPDGLLVLGLDESAAPDMFEAAPGGRGLFKLSQRSRATA